MIRLLIPNQRRRVKSETYFHFAVIGCEKHVEIGQKLPKYAAEPPSCIYRLTLDELETPLNCFVIVYIFLQISIVEQIHKAFLLASEFFPKG